MLDIKYIRENADKLKKAIADKAMDLDLDFLLDLDEQRRKLLAETETLQAAKHAASLEIPNLQGSERDAKLLEMKEVDAEQQELKVRLKNVELEYESLMLMVPNIPSPESPLGPDEKSNIPWSYWSPALGHVDPKEDDRVKQVPTKFTFTPKDHIALAKDLDLLDTERGVKVSGSRGYYLKNEAVLLQQALVWHAILKMREKGFNLFVPPTLVREFALVGSGHFPFGKAEVYQIGNPARLDEKDAADHKETQYLAGTSEPSLLAYYADEILREDQLPIKMAGVSTCYRSEVGSYGKDTKGIYRMHEFVKVEQVIICKAELNESEKWHETLREIAEEMLQDLKLPYRVLNIATGDMGAGKYKMYDIETWMPSRESYGETHSDSNLTDWQARRLNIRYKDSDGKIKFVHTLNNTVIASPRILIAILENYQQADGTVRIPDVLQKYIGMDFIKSKSAPETTSPQLPVEPKSAVEAEVVGAPEAEAEDKPEEKPTDETKAGEEPAEEVKPEEVKEEEKPVEETKSEQVAPGI